MNIQTTGFVKPTTRPDVSITYRQDGEPLAVLHIDGLTMSNISLSGRPEDIDHWLEQAVAAFNKARQAWLAHRLDDARHEAEQPAGRLTMAGDLVAGDIIDVPGDDSPKGVTLARTIANGDAVHLIWDDARVALPSTTRVVHLGHASPIVHAPTTAVELMAEHGIKLVAS